LQENDCLTRKSSLPLSRRLFLSEADSNADSQRIFKEALQIKVDGSLDPLTVVAKGAAMFGNQTAVSIQDKQGRQQNAVCQLEVNYNPVTSDDEQTDYWERLLHARKDSQPYSIQFTGSDDSFSSEEILIKNGKFILTLPTGVKGTQYWIYIKDSTGKLIASSPDSIHITRGVSIMGAPLPYSIGVSVISLSSLIRVMPMLPKQWNSSSLKTVFYLLKRRNVSIQLQI
jgi:hypothetical protein